MLVSSTSGVDVIQFLGATNINYPITANTADPGFWLGAAVTINLLPLACQIPINVSLEISLV